MSQKADVRAKEPLAPSVGLEIRVYPLRWVIITLFALYAACSAMQWVQYCIISDIIMRYYGITALAVDWTSLISMVTYPPLAIPGSYVIDKLGLRVCALLGVVGTAIGTWIKVFSVDPTLFWVGFLGQTVVFVSQIFILSLPSRVAAVWFGKDEISTACSLGVFGTQFGTAVGFILPRLLVKNHENLENISSELSVMFYGVAIFTTIIAVLVVIYFKAEPELPPSLAQAELRDKRNEYTWADFRASYRSLLTDKPFLMLTLAYGINVGVFAGICTVLNQIILAYFPENGEDTGRIGLLMVVIGMLGSIIFGYILDKTRRYKETIVAIYAMVALGMGAFTFALETRSLGFVYVTSILLGFFQNAYYPVGFEMAAELTFPQPENASSGILMSMAQILGVTFTLLMDSIFEAVGPFWGLVAMTVVLVLGTILTALTPNVLRRQEALRGDGLAKTDEKNLVI